MSKPTPRELLATADRHKRISDAADAIRCSMRILTAQPGARGGLLGMFRSNREPQFQPFDQDMTAALYRALGVVHHEEAQYANDAEARVTTGDAQ